MSGNSAFHHIGVVVENIEASAAWYADKLGFELLLNYDWPGVQVAFISRGDVRIELFQNDEGHRCMPVGSRLKRT